LPRAHYGAEINEVNSKLGWKEPKDLSTFDDFKANSSRSPISLPNHGIMIASHLLGAHQGFAVEDVEAGSFPVQFFDLPRK
jgi:hypothetical protein